MTDHATIVITGATGTVGRYLTRLLRAILTARPRAATVFRPW